MNTHTHMHFLWVVPISAPGSCLNEISATNFGERWTNLSVWRCCRCRQTDSRQWDKNTNQETTKHSIWFRLIHPNHHPELSRSWDRLRKRGWGLWLSGLGQDTSLQLQKPGYPAGLPLPTRHVLEFHLGNWLSVLDISLAKVENSFPSLMDRHSHFQSEADERERSGVPLGENRFCISGLKRLQHWLVTPNRWEMSWDGFLLFFALTHKPSEFKSAGVRTGSYCEQLGKVTVLPARRHKGDGSLANSTI